MSSGISWDRRIGRQLKLKDLDIFVTVSKCGSMAGAARELGITQPTVSESIAKLEHLFRVRLLDRTPSGIAPTIYGTALLKRSTIAFEELRQGGNDIEQLSDPQSGELHIACQVSITATTLPPIVEAFAQHHPRAVLHVDDISSVASQLAELRSRRYEVALARIGEPLEGAPDINTEILFQDQLVIAVGMQSPWAHRRRIDLADLANESWIMSPSNSANYGALAQAFRQRGLEIPKARVVTLSVPLRGHLLASGKYVTAVSASGIRPIVDRYPLKVLPIQLPASPRPVMMLTVKDRTLSPLATRFLRYARECVDSR